MFAMKRGVLMPMVLRFGGALCALVAPPLRLAGLPLLFLLPSSLSTSREVLTAVSQRDILDVITSRPLIPTNNNDH